MNRYLPSFIKNSYLPTYGLDLLNDDDECAFFLYFIKPRLLLGVRRTCSIFLVHSFCNLFHAARYFHTDTHTQRSTISNIHVPLVIVRPLSQPLGKLLLRTVKWVTAHSSDGLKLGIDIFGQLCQLRKQRKSHFTPESRVCYHGARENLFHHATPAEICGPWYREPHAV